MSRLSWVPSAAIVTEVGADVHHVCVGDRVVAIAGDCFATEVIAEGHSVARFLWILTTFRADPWLHDCRSGFERRGSASGR